MHIKRAAVVLFSISAFSWLGCGGNGPCDKADQASQNLANAAASCPSFGGGGDGGTQVFSSLYSKAICQSALSSCTAADQQTLSNAFDCLGKVNRCVPGQEPQFLGSVFVCLMPAANLSQACQTAFRH
jgi:hypothetical protein